MKKVLILILFFPLYVYSNSNATQEGKKSNLAGLQLLKEEKYAAAEDAFIYATECVPDNKFYFNNLAVSQINLKKYKKAYKNLLKAIDIDKNYVKAFSNLAVACFYLREYRRAYFFYREAQSLDEKYIKNRFGKKKLQERIRKLYRENPENSEYRRLYLRSQKD